MKRGTTVADCHDEKCRVALEAAIAALNDPRRCSSDELRLVAIAKVNAAIASLTEGGKS